MKIGILLVMCLLFLGNDLSETGFKAIEKTKKLADNTIYDQHNWKPGSGIIPPRLANGSSNVDSLIMTHLESAEVLKNKSINTVFNVAMVFEKDGHVSSFTPSKSAHPLVATEVVRMLKRMPKAKPATKNGKPVRFRMYYEFSFKNN